MDIELSKSILGILKATTINDKYNYITPKDVEKITKNKHKVVVQQGIGDAIGFTDNDYIDAGAVLIKSAKQIFDECTHILKENKLELSEYKLLRPTQILITLFKPSANPEAVKIILDNEGIAFTLFDNFTDGEEHHALPYLINLLDNGIFEACTKDGYLRRSLVTYNGILTHEETSFIQNIPWMKPEVALGISHRKDLNKAPKATKIESKNYITKEHMETEYTAEGLVEYAKKWLKLPNIYVWDGWGQHVTEKWISSHANSMPHWYTAERTDTILKVAGKGWRGWDCSGFIMSYYWGNYDENNKSKFSYASHAYANQMISRAEKKGDISTLPERPGICLWKEGHVGVYIGDNFAIECTILGDLKINGLGKTRVNDRPWEMWFECPYIKY